MHIYNQTVQVKKLELGHHLLLLYLQLLLTGLQLPWL